MLRSGLVDRRRDGNGDTGLQSLRITACRRAVIGLNHAITGVVGREEEEALERGEPLSGTPATPPEGAWPDQAPDLSTLVKWIKEGRREEVLPHIGMLSKELQPLVDLILKRDR